MMLDSGTTSHLTPKGDRFRSTMSSNVNINLADDSSVKAFSKGVREVRWMTKRGGTKISLSETLVVPNLAMSLFSFPALAQKTIATLFRLRTALMSNLNDNMNILGQAC